METYEYSYDTETIVQQLTSILDFLDERYESNAFNKNKATYTALVSELSLCLKDKHNMNLLPYLYVLRRYEHSPCCLENIIEIHHKNNTRSVSRSFNTHFC